MRNVARLAAYQVWRFFCKRSVMDESWFTPDPAPLPTPPPPIPPRQLAVMADQQLRQQLEDAAKISDRQLRNRAIAAAEKQHREALARYYQGA